MSRPGHPRWRTKHVAQGTRTATFEDCLLGKPKWSTKRQTPRFAWSRNLEPISAGESFVRPLASNGKRRMGGASLAGGPASMHGKVSKSKFKRKDAEVRTMRAGANGRFPRARKSRSCEAGHRERAQTPTVSPPASRQTLENSGAEPGKRGRGKEESASARPRLRVSPEHSQSGELRPELS